MVDIMVDIMVDSDALHVSFCFSVLFPWLTWFARTLLGLSNFRGVFLAILCRWGTIGGEADDRADVGRGFFWLELIFT